MFTKIKEISLSTHFNLYLIIFFHLNKFVNPYFKIISPYNKLLGYDIHSSKLLIGVSKTSIQINIFVNDAQGKKENH